MWCLQLSCLNLIIQNGNKNTAAACLKRITISTSIFTLVNCKTVTTEAGREHTDFDTNSVNNAFYHKATFTSLFRSSAHKTQL